MSPLGWCGYCLVPCAPPPPFQSRSTFRCRYLTLLCLRVRTRLTQVHLANLFGEDKVSFDDRVAFVEQHMDKVSRPDRTWQFFSFPLRPALVFFFVRQGRPHTIIANTLSVFLPNMSSDTFFMKASSMRTYPTCFPTFTGGPYPLPCLGRSETVPHGRWMATAGGRTRTAPGSASPFAQTSWLPSTAQTPPSTSLACPCTRTVRTKFRGLETRIVLDVDFFLLK